jgi:uncharacterized protein
MCRNVLAPLGGLWAGCNQSRPWWFSLRRGAVVRGTDRKMARFESIAYIESEISPAGSSADALFELGLMYCAGRDVEMDFVAAHKWFNLAALRGNVEAKTYRMELSREMSKRQIAEAQRQAREWLRIN